MSRCLTQESKFLVLNKKSAWDRGLSINLDVSEDGLKIRKVFEYVFEAEDEIEVLSDTFAVTDFAVAGCNQLYILDAKTPAIWIYDTSQKLIEKIDCISPLFKDPTSITYVSGTLYVADIKAEARIYGLSDQNWQVKFAIAAFPKDTLSLSHPFEPIDLAVDGEGNLFALDQSAPAIFKFDETSQLVKVFGQLELNGKQPTSIALSRDGSLYVLDLKDQKVLKFQTREGTAVNANFINFESLKTSGALPKEFKPSGFAVDTGGNLFVGDAGVSRSKQEDDRFIRKFGSDGKYLGIVEDSRGAADRLVVDLNDSIFIFRKEKKNIVTALRREKRFALLEGASLVKGEYISKALDSRDAGTIWHKLTSEAASVANAQIQVSFLAADEKVKIGGEGKDLDAFLDETAKLDVTQQVEIENNLANLDKLNWSTPIVNSDDALIAAEGRYLWIRIVLIGNERESPAVHSLRVDYPRLSYLRYLPSVYQEEERSRDFLERFLSLFETFFAGIETRVDHIARYFEPDASVVCGDFLRWLSTWLAVSVDNNWDEAKLRVLVKRAAEIYQKRGTRSAIEEMIEIFTGQQPIIVEHYQISCDSWSPQQQELDFEELKKLFKRLYGKDSFADDELEQSFVLEKLYERLYGNDPFCFCVLLKPFPVQTEEHYKAVRRILDSEKPAHTCAGLLALQPWVQLDTHTYLEVNTYLSEPSARLDLGSAMPRDTVLNDFEEAGQLERRSRIDLDMTLT